MEDEVSTGSDIAKLELALVLLDLFHASLNKKAVLLLQVCHNSHIEFVS